MRMLFAFADAPVAVPEATALALRYYRSGVVLWWAGQALALAVPLALLLTGASTRMRSTADRVGGRRFLADGLFGAMYAAVFATASLPLAYYSGYLRPRWYGLAAPGYTAWHFLADEAKSLAVAAPLAFVIVGLIYVAIRRLPRFWPWATAIGYVPIAFALMFAAPIFVDPLFDNFGPMANRDLEAKILALADRAGIDGGRVYEVDMSRRTKSVNAYVKGFLGTKRIVLYDTLTQRLDEPGVLFVMGHEMGHFVLGHVSRTLLLGALGVLVLTLTLRLAATFVLARMGPRLGVRGLSDVASLPLLLVLGNLLVLAFSPVGLAYSRYQEQEADRFALELTHGNRAGALAFVAMQGANLSNPRPGPLSVLWRSTHPSLAQRIEFCNTYRPWATGGRCRYDGMFREP